MLEVMCIAIRTEVECKCGCIADYPLKLKGGIIFPLCWQHNQMIKSGWYFAAGDDSFYPDEALRFYRTSDYGK